MPLLHRRTRSATALLAVAAAFPLFAAPAGAAPSRQATTSDYTHATFLQSALGLPASDTNPVIEPVTYDRFQWLLQQGGNHALLIGDPATDPSFAARAQDVEIAASEAGVKRVYWFNPNLSGNAKVGATVEPNLDIRNPGGITSIAPASRTIYGHAWLNLVARYLGNGASAEATGVDTGSAKVTTTIGTTTVNDIGRIAGASTEVGDTSGGALFDYTSGAAPADVTESYFLVYDKARTVTPQGSSSPQPSKIVAWVDLTDKPTAAATRADVTTAIGKVGASNIASPDEFAWWKSSNNTKQATQSPAEANGSKVPTLTDADNDAADGGWRVKQLTYPELVHLLKTEKTKNAVVLFGGTWCPNTRPVLPSINEHAQDNGVTVFNFDTVLDGGVVGGGTTSGTNPIQIRNAAASGGVANANPSFLYGDLVKQYLGNLKTQYDAVKGPNVTYYPGGDAGGTLTTTARLQVPYLIGYQGAEGDAPHGGVTRQWIHTNADGTYTEYMSQWWYTHPQPNQLGIANIPLAAPIWSKINAQLKDFTWQTDPATLYPNTAVDTDDAEYLVAEDTATAKYTAAAGATPASVSISSGGATAVAISPAALSSALTALGASAPTNLAAARAAFIAAKTAATPDPALLGSLETVVGAWGVAQQRKTKVISTWGTAATPGSVAGGIAAVRASNRFFAGLPGPVAVDEPGPTPTPTPTPDAVEPTPAPSVAPVATAPVVAKPLTDVKPVVTPAPVKPAPTKVVAVKATKVAGAVAKAPTSRKPGTYKVSVTAASGRPAAGGKVTVKLKKGKTAKAVTGVLKNGVLTVAVPKLAKGTWKVTISWVGDANHLATRIAGASVKVKK